MTSNTEPLQRTLITTVHLLERYGVIDFNGHASVKLDDGRVMINSADSIRCALTPNDLVVVNADGSVDASQPRPPNELALHLAVYQARPDVKAVVHGHPEWSTLLTSAGQPYQVVFPQGAVPGDVPVFDSPRSISNAETANAVAALLGNGKAALMKAHGCVTVAEDLLEAAVLAIYLEMNAERQVRCAPLGGAYVFTDAEVEGSRKGLSKRALYEKCWGFFKAKYKLPR
ncbi:class II aldolase/adducin family protein [Saccharospirillum sp.]|uniref:class II aldolase/adducin family protein n=1 Tax=Saccharospirillum sp. TaxID=2033801 RepID=UPI0034A01ED5